MNKTTFFLGATAACAFALPAAAQDLCGGAVSSGAWIGGDEANSDISTAGSHSDQLALVLLGNAHVSLFTVSSPTDVRLEAQGQGSGDPLIELLDGNGSVVGGDDDGGGGTSSLMTQTLQPGQYCLLTNSYDTMAPLTATVRIGRTEHEALTEVGQSGGDRGGEGSDGGGDMPPVEMDDCGGLWELADGPIDGQLGGGGITMTETINQVPGYSFQLASDAMITITAENEAADPVLTITDSTGGFIAENDDFDGLNSRIDFTTPLAAGNYCIKLDALSDGNVPVTVSVTEYDPAAAAAAMYDRGETAPPMDGSYPITDIGTIDGRVVEMVQIDGDDAKWFSVSVDAAGLLLIEAIGGNMGDPVLRLFDDVGREIGYNDDFGMGLDSQVAARVQPGTFLLAVMDISGSSPQLRVVMERFVSAR
ncbi:N-carbamoyl-L-amino acid amidohydrolase [Oceanicola granulosus HTCC2516]|uniref:N-carbamoyl-L-amino acid amidohydrolase n=1 Tax=Oceanicola granulosus (strain ATCC BAA-861 / DSM 15982 / KCTC 12143 / HTCC2516) TaxID=314256 RepID=Q2CDK4_OCEGH|nr:hypothetical protein [Oceanicola granulosus]EAR50707.1 N-carbamoyl-L-amino acid amidohydrolase [Oceanicola granulosus HTCC2516]